jgi:NADH:ubiquinone oxidoreductase subunit 4 (subunit M)
MISHGIVSGALFLCVGVVYDRMHTREIAAYGGLVNRMPLYAFVFMVFTLANVGLPGTSGFIGEFLSLIGTFKVNIPVATLATFGVILSAAYALWLYRKMIFGTLKPSLEGIRDIGWRECVILAQLVVLTILFGVKLKPALDIPAPSVTQPLRTTITRSPRPKRCAPGAIGEAMTQLPALQDLLPLLPELILACGAMLMLMIGAMIGERSSAAVNGWCVVILALAAAALLWLPRGPHVMFGGSFLVDEYARFLKILTLIGSGGALLLSLDYLTLEKQQKFEYGTLFLLATLGMLVLISAVAVSLIYIGLELMSLPLYVIAASNRENTR